jgi:hypothetical protein
LQLEANLLLGQIQIGGQRRLLLGARDRADDALGAALRKQLAAECRQQRTDALQRQMLRGLLAGVASTR